MCTSETNITDWNCKKKRLILNQFYSKPFVIVNQERDKAEFNK